MTFEWDDDKNRQNRKKHGIDFETAVLVFLDDLRIEYWDKQHSENESRYITIGAIGEFIAIVTVVYTERNGHIRVISARKASSQEREAYYESFI